MKLKIVVSTILLNMLSILTAFGAKFPEGKNLREDFSAETTFKWSGSEKLPKPSLEIRNRDKYPLQVTVENDNKKQEFVIPANNSKFFERDIPVVRLGNLDLMHSKTKIFIVFEKDGKRFEHIYFIPRQKTIFVSWENGNLRAQKGVRGMSQSGLSIGANNVTNKDLEKDKGTRQL